MFTGIVRGRGTILAADPRPAGTRFRIRFPEPLLGGLEIGASVAIDGVCLTVVACDGHVVDFDAIHGTLDVTNLGDRRIGDKVNLERSAVYGTEIGGHVVSGHVSITAELTGLNLEDADAHIEFRVPPEWCRYIFLRGFLAVDGASLTVAHIDEAQRLFRINLIPETLRSTCVGRYRVGDRINIEVEHHTQVMVDVISRTIRDVMAGNRGYPPPDQP
ncbi:MAG: riboflavin synthase subunit alpha [Methylococcaceae bacterium]|nr:riboflavin synthase subunit alpha [Methylococcaceae bacterium]